MDDPLAPLREIEDLIHPEGRQPVRELKSDRPPRVLRGKREASHPVAPKVDPKEQEAINFAKRIADRIEHARSGAAFAQWVLIAPPNFLGVLRAALSSAAVEHLVQTVDKNLVQQTAAKIREYLTR
jgi:protein required for attachment to host cells